jgi:hypothetical protein
MEDDDYGWLKPAVWCLIGGAFIGSIAMYLALTTATH